MEVDRIDLLLERYLHLLHEYTTLREQLSTLQTGMYQNIARANFAAERGMRFGQDFYDERMQASRKLAITPAGGNDDDNNQEHIPVPVFAIAVAGSTEPEVSEKGAATASTTTDDGIRDEEGGKEEEEETREPSPNKKERRNDDPLRWFGLLTPMPLRQAQAQSIQAVEQVIPKLVSVNAQMAQVEIEVRRARKKRAKAEAAAIKQEQGVGAGAEITA
ncbi:hypothetical protein Daesc_008591 [Daldinia eschscholtzii]|uniref:Vacuolar ATPase assembly protein VMA22 n=1 Tax=Daldinia eschscholtzii TaxID=292717 RepID=A0AAX6MC95_9PEZI